MAKKTSKTSMTKATHTGEGRAKKEEGMARAKDAGVGGSGWGGGGGSEIRRNQNHNGLSGKNAFCLAAAPSCSQNHGICSLVRAGTMDTATASSAG